jgi:hypothetical protein
MQRKVIMKVLDLSIANEFISQRGSAFLDESNAILACLQI